MAEKKNQLYCVVATDKETKIRDVVAGTAGTDKKQAEESVKNYNKNTRAKKILRYFKVAKYPYKKRIEGDR